MRHRQAKLRRLLTCKRDDLRELFGGELRGNAASIVVAENVEDERLEIVVVDLLRLRAGEHPYHVGPSAPPAPHSLRVDAERRRLLDAKDAVGGQQHDLRALDKALFCSRRTAQALKDRALTLRDDDDRRVLRHQRHVIHRADKRNCRKDPSGSPPPILGAGLGVGGAWASGNRLPPRPACSSPPPPGERSAPKAPKAQVEQT